MSATIPVERIEFDQKTKQYAAVRAQLPAKYCRIYMTKELLTNIANVLNNQLALSKTKFEEAIKKAQGELETKFGANKSELTTDIEQYTTNFKTTMETKIPKIYDAQTPKDQFIDPAKFKSQLDISRKGTENIIQQFIKDQGTRFSRYNTDIRKIIKDYESVVSRAESEKHRKLDEDITQMSGEVTTSTAPDRRYPKGQPGQITKIRQSDNTVTIRIATKLAKFNILKDLCWWNDEPQKGGINYELSENWLDKYLVNPENNYNLDNLNNNYPENYNLNNQNNLNNFNYQDNNPDNFDNQQMGGFLDTASDIEPLLRLPLNFR